jgi:hypothetical protein
MTCGNVWPGRLDPIMQNYLHLEIIKKDKGVFGSKVFPNQGFEMAWHTRGIFYKSFRIPKFRI